MFNKRPEIEFFSIQPEITKLAPIIPAHEIKPKWFDKAQDDFVITAKLRRKTIMKNSPNRNRASTT